MGDRGDSDGGRAPAASPAAAPPRPAEPQTQRGERGRARELERARVARRRQKVPGADGRALDTRQGLQHGAALAGSTVRVGHAEGEHEPAQGQRPRRESQSSRSRRVEIPMPAPMHWVARP